MASQAISGIGAVFNRWTNSAWVAIAEVVSIGGPKPTRETIDVTSLDSTGGYREFIGSLRDGGAVDLTLNFRRDSYEIMKADFESDVLQSYQIALPDDDNTVLEFTGLVTDIPLNIQMDDKITVEVSIKISGQVTLDSE